MKPLNKITKKIFTNVKTSLSLVLINKKWYKRSKEPKLRTKWIINKYGKLHALFHTIRYGNDFISLELVDILIKENVIFSRYLAQRLLLQFGQTDEILIRLKLQHEDNSDNNNINNNNQKISKYYRNPWASNIPMDVFAALLEEARSQYGPDLPLKGDDIETFHYLTGGPLAIDLAPKKSNENIEQIKDLILNKKICTISSTTNDPIRRLD